LQEKPRRKEGCEHVAELFYTSLYTSALPRGVVGFYRVEHPRRTQLTDHQVVVLKVAGLSTVGHPESGFRKGGN
jgi:hypothetical protein